MLRFTCLNHNLQKSFSLIQDLLCHPEFKDVSNLNTVLSTEASNLSSSLIEDSLSYAMSQSSSSLKEENWMNDDNKYFDLVTKLARNYSKAGPGMKEMYADDINF